MSKKFEQQLAELGITLTQTQFNQFDKYYEMLKEWNKEMNLNGIPEYEKLHLVRRSKRKTFCRQPSISKGPGYQ